MLNNSQKRTYLTLSQDIGIAKELALSIANDSSSISTLSSNLGKLPITYKQEYQQNTVSTTTTTTAATTASVTTPKQTNTSINTSLNPKSTKSPSIIIDITDEEDISNVTLTDCRGKIESIKVSTTQLLVYVTYKSTEMEGATER